MVLSRAALPFILTLDNALFALRLPDVRLPGRPGFEQSTGLFSYRQASNPHNLPLRGD